MAIIKKIETQSGVTVRYHNATIFKDATNNTLQVYLNSYASKAAREAGKPPVVEAKSYSVPVEAWKGVEGGIEAAVYAYLKTLPEFEGAADD